MSRQGRWSRNGERKRKGKRRPRGWNGVKGWSRERKGGKSVEKERMTGQQLASRPDMLMTVNSMMKCGK